MVEAADIFNASQYRRTVGGIGRSLGAPKVSVIVLSGTNADVAVTVAWEISWYQYRIAPDSEIPCASRAVGRIRPSSTRVRRVERAHGGRGRVVPDIARL